MQTTKKVLIADTNSVGTKNLSDYLLQKPEIGSVETVTNGEEALDMLRKTTYDFLLLELALPILDGFGVLEQIHSGMLEAAPKTLILSSMRNEEIVRKACSLGASYYMIKPAEPEMIYRRMMESDSFEVFSEYSPKTAKMSFDDKLSLMFLRLGIPAHIRGYQYLKRAVKIVYEHPETINRITKELYPAVATECKTTPSKVERAIRHAIEVAWARGRIENINKIFGVEIFGRNDKPTNGEFIALIADRLLA